MGILSVSVRERKRAEILEKRKRKEITQREAASIMRLTVRQVRRLEDAYSLKGLEGLVHGNRAKPSLRRTAPEKKNRILVLMKTKYKGFGSTLAAEMLYEEEGIEVTKQTLTRFLKEAGLWVRKRKHGSHRYWRKPKNNEGQMQQLDGSDHDWFEGRAPRCVLIKFIDDATGKIWARFFPSESFDSVARATYEYIKAFGRPISLYTDCGKVFRVNKGNKEKEFITQYQRILKDLDIELIFAYSPQAKGRVERSFGTDQDRLVKLMTIRGISSIEEGNKFLEEYYIPKHNSKFARTPQNAENLHRSIEGMNLEDIFSRQHTRKVANDWTIQCNNKIYQLHEDQPITIRPKSELLICERLDGSIYIKMKGHHLNFTEITKRVKIAVIQPAKEHRPQIPSKDHPWRRTNSLFYQKS